MENEKSHQPKIDQTAITLNYIRDRRTELLEMGRVLLGRARGTNRYSSLITVAVIVLGAFVSTKAVADKLLGSTNTLDVVIYAFVGLLIAVLTGLESAFKWNSKSAELRNVAASCQKCVFEIDAGLRKLPDDEPQNRQQRHDAAVDLLQRINQELYTISAEVLKLGINIPSFARPSSVRYYGSQ